MSPEHHDYLQDADIQEVYDQNLAMLESHYMGRLSAFRSAVFTHLLDHGALPDNEGWAVFYTSGDNQGDTLNSDGAAKGLLVTVEHVLINGSKPFIPNIRFLENEIQVRNDGSNHIITRDFTADGLNNSWCFIDIVSPGSTTPELSGRTAGTLFGITDDGTLVTNGPTITPVRALEVKNLRSVVMGDDLPLITPFGMYGNLMDSLHALDVMQELFSGVQALKPSFCYQPIEEN